MNWYLVKMVFRIVCGNGDHKAQFDEQLRLINADSREEAFGKAARMGKTENDSFYNNQEQMVQWRFINISELHLLSELIDGAELYSRIEETENAEAYTHTVHQKAEAIHSLHHQQLL